MKALVFLIFTSAFVFSFPSSAKNTNAKTKKTRAKIATSQKNSKLETDVNFSGSAFLGQYANFSEVNADIEADKKLINVVEPRKDFKWQLKTSRGWH